VLKNKDQLDVTCYTDTTPTRPHRNSSTHRTKNNTTNVVIQQNSRKLLMMDISMPEPCWAHKKWNRIASDIKLVFYSSTFTMMHGPINISVVEYLKTLLNYKFHSRSVTFTFERQTVMADVIIIYFFASFSLHMRTKRISSLYLLTYLLHGAESFLRS